jgi:hypothetical protein
MNKNEEINHTKIHLEVRGELDKRLSDDRGVRVVTPDKYLQLVQNSLVQRKNFIRIVENFVSHRVLRSPQQRKTTINKIVFKIIASKKDNKSLRAYNLEIRRVCNVCALSNSTGSSVKVREWFRGHDGCGEG